MCKMLILRFGFFITLLLYSLQVDATAGSTVRIDTIMVTDQVRGRMIPVAIYIRPDLEAAQSRLMPVILNHGYDQNRGNAYLDYSYLAIALAQSGYFVVSIQHEQKDDSLLSMTPPFRDTRRSNWERGSANILAVLQWLRLTYPLHYYAKLSLIGHSNGGDIAALFTAIHPELVHKLITLDNRRMPLPRTSEPMIYSLRSSDLPADDEVLPANVSGVTGNVRLVFLKRCRHNDMDNSGTRRQHKLIVRFVKEFLADEWKLR
jgi:pimeloyl-ACP methyl ester carboxylesterase